LPEKTPNNRRSSPINPPSEPTMNLIQICIRQPITVAVGILLTLLAGYLAVTRVPVEMTPEVQKGVISVTTTYPNGSPDEVEREIAEQQEDQLRELSGLERMTSTSSSGQAVLRLELLTDTNIESAMQDVSRLINQVPGYPAGVLEPVIEAVDPESQDYIAWFLIGFDGNGEAPEEFDIQELFDYVDNRVRPRLERIPGISQVNVLGGRQRELQVRVDPEKLAQRGLTMADLLAVIENANRDFSGGQLTQDIRETTIRVPNRWTSERQAADTVLRNDEGGPIYLSDVAEIEETFREKSGFIRSNGRPVLALNFQREIGSNVLQVMDQLKAEVEAVNADGGPLDSYVRVNNLDGELKMIQAYDQTVYVDQAIVMVRNNLLIGAALAVFVLLLFLRSLRPVGIVALAIPVSVVGAAVVMVSVGRTVNVVSLAGVAFSIGLVVDNSIVVLENIFRHLQMGKTPPRAAYDGAKEVALAVLASTLTTVVVFVPVLLISELVGQLFRDIAVAIVSSVLISYVVSILVIPSAAAILLKKQERTKMGQAKKDEDANQPAWKRRLGKIFAVPDFIAAAVHFVNGSWLLRIGAVASALVLVGVGVAVLLPPLDYLPKGNRNIVFGLVFTPPGYSVDKVDELAAGVEANMRPYFEAGDEGFKEPDEVDLPVVPVRGDPLVSEVEPPPLDRYFIVNADGQLFHGAISASDGKVIDMVPLFNQATGGILDSFSAAFQLPIFRLGGSSGSAVKVDIVGDSLDDVTNTAGALFGSLMGEFDPSGLRPTPANFNIRGNELQIVPNEFRAADVGLDSTDVGRIVQANADGIILRDAYKYPDELGDIKVITKQAAEDNAIARLGDVPVATPGGTVPLSSIATISETLSPNEIRRVDGRRAVTIEVTADGVPLGEAVDTINQTIEGLRQGGAVPPGVSVDVAGTASAFDAIKQTLLGDGTILGTITSSAVLAIFAVYLLMCVLFQSWTYPLVIMITVPLATFGGFVGLFLVNWWSSGDRYLPTTQLDVLAMLGFIILTGTVVNNAILIVEQSLNFLRMSGDELDDACVDCHGEKQPSGQRGLGARRAITEATRSRVRPIFMSMLTSVGGMLPLVLIPGPGSELYRGLGAVVVGGLAVSTVFTLFICPALLSLVMDLKTKFGSQLILARNTNDLGESKDEPMKAVPA
jgi:HAE1 family hydrophobic/amphiphilic exporter-1